MKHPIAAALAGAVLFAAAPAAQAATITVSDCYTGGCALVTGSITVDISDPADTPGNLDRVLFTVTNNTNGFLTDLGLFYDGGLPASTVLEDFQALVGNGAQAPALSLGPVNGTGNIGQSLNFLLAFTQSNQNSGALRFNAGEQVSFYLDADVALDVAALLTQGYAHVQGLPQGQSAKLRACTSGAECHDSPDTPHPPHSVPEPTSLALVGLGLLGAGLARRRK